MATKQRRKKTKQPKNQRSLRRLWVHDSGNFFVLRINNGTEAFDYFVTYLGESRYRLTKLVPNAMKVYVVNIDEYNPRYGCQCESFKQSCSRDGDGSIPTCKHIDALMKIHSF